MDKVARFDEYVPEIGDGDVEESIYGFPLTSNPLDFFPDHEWCTPEEIAAWEADCERARKGEVVDNPRAGTGWGYDAEGNRCVHVNATRWGIGVSRLRSKN